MYTIRRASNYVKRADGTWKLHSSCLYDSKGYSLKFETLREAEDCARNAMEMKYYSNPNDNRYIVYCTIYYGKKKIKRIDR